LPSRLTGEAPPALNRFAESINRAAKEGKSTELTGKAQKVVFDDLHTIYRVTHKAATKFIKQMRHRHLDSNDQKNALIDFFDPLYQHRFKLADTLIKQWGHGNVLVSLKDIHSAHLLGDDLFADLGGEDPWRGQLYMNLQDLVLTTIARAYTNAQSDNRIELDPENDLIDDQIPVFVKRSDGIRSWYDGLNIANTTGGTSNAAPNVTGIFVTDLYRSGKTLRVTRDAPISPDSTPSNGTAEKPQSLGNNNTNRFGCKTDALDCG